MKGLEAKLTLFHFYISAYVYKNVNYIMLIKFFNFIKKFFKIKRHMKKIKKYKVSPDESLCLAISVVDKPAVESEFVFMEQQKENFVAVEKKEKRMIYGCALRADFPIYRNSEERGEYYIEFDAEAIDKISKNFMKNGFQSNWTVGHQAEVEGLTVTEIWLKESPTMDKSIALGLDASIPVGSLFIGCYCENDEIWDAVKNGAYHGYSIEALVGLEEFEAQMKEDDVDVETSEASKITTEELAENSGFTNVEDYKNEVEAIKEELEEETPAVETPNNVQETPSEPSKVDEPITTPTEEKETIVEENKDNHLEELINSMKAEIAALKEFNTSLQDKVKGLEKEPSVKPVNVNSKPNAGDTYSQWRETVAKYLS